MMDMVSSVKKKVAVIDQDIVKFTLSATRSAACAAPFVVNKDESVKTKTKYGGIKKYHVKPGNFAKVHCWVSAIDPRNKSIRCDGIDIFGNSLFPSHEYGIMSKHDWEDNENRVKRLVKECVNNLLNVG